MFLRPTNPALSLDAVAAFFAWLELQVRDLGANLGDSDVGWSSEIECLDPRPPPNLLGRTAGSCTPS